MLIFSLNYVYWFYYVFRFAIVNLDKKYPSFVSHYVRYDSNPNVVSEQHCQEEQDGSVCKLIVATPSAKENPNGDLQYGGKKFKKSNKTKKYKKRNVQLKKKRIKLLIILLYTNHN